MLGCHVSALLKEEQKIVDSDLLKEKIEEVEGTDIVVQFTGGVEMFEKYDEKKGWIWLLALTVESEDILNFREKVKLPRKPEKLTLHCTLLEKIIGFE